MHQRLILAIALTLTALGRPELRATALVHGRVVADDSGLPLANACLVLGKGDDAVATDSEGRFAIPDDSETLVSVSKSGYATAQTALRPDADIRLARGAVIAGHVLDDDGHAIALMSVVAERRIAEGGGVRFEREAWVETDDTGAYRLFGLAAGDYVVGIAGGRLAGVVGTAPIPFDRLVRHYYPRAEHAIQADVVTVRAGTELTGIDFAIHAGPPTGTRPVPSALETQPGHAALRGRVLRSDGLAARAARVQLMSPDRLFTPFDSTTDADGRYEFTDLKPGRYLVTATDPLSLTSARFGQRGPLDRGTIVTLTAGAEIDGIDISMPRGSVVAGRIVDEYGEPMENANVRLQRIVWNRGRRRLAPIRGMTTSDTDDQGRYRIFGVPPGRYVVSAAIGQPRRPFGTVNHLPGYVRTYFPGAPSPGDAQPLDVSAGDLALNVNFALARAAGGRVSGRVLSANGQPFRGAVHVMASARSGAVAGEADETVQTRDGTFGFDHLPPGEYVVQAATARKSPSHEGEFGLQFVTLGGSQPADIVVRMTAGSALTGRLTFDGDPPPDASGIEIAAVPSDPDFISLADNPPARADIHDDWTFDLEGVSGPRRLAVITGPDGWTLERVTLDGRDVTDEPFLIGNDVAGTFVDIAFTRRATAIAGTVTDESGTALSDVAVIAFSVERARWHDHSRFVRYVRTSADGGFDLRGLPAATYNLVAFDARAIDDVIDQLSNPDFLAGLIPSSTQVAIDAAHPRRLTLRLSSR